MSSLVTATLLDDPGASTGVVVVAIVTATIGTIATFVLARLDLLDTWWWVLIDGAGTLFILLAPGLAESGDLFYGGYGLSWLLLVVWVYPAVLPAAVAITAVVTAQLIGNAIGVRETSLTNTVGDVAVWVVSGIVYGWAFWAVRAGDLRRQSAEMALAREREERTLAEARAAIADDIHDSVLQSLAYIQRHSTDPAVAGVASDQDRDLRRYLDRLSAEHPDGLEVLLRAVAWEVEDRHEVDIEVVTVGDCSKDDAVGALVAAAREAMVNSATHSGARLISVYAEVGDDAARVFVRDTGVGFDATGTPAAGRGLRHSIIGRIERHGGSAEITSAPGAGTEVVISVPITST